MTSPGGRVLDLDARRGASACGSRSTVGHQPVELRPSRSSPARFGRSRAVGRQALDRVDDVHAAGHAAEHGVLAVEPRRGLGGDDEELRAVGVRPGVGHRQRAADDLVLVELVLERVAGAAGAGALRAAALDHEVADDPVEDQPVVEAVARRACGSCPPSWARRRRTARSRSGRGSWSWSSSDIVALLDVSCPRTGSSASRAAANGGARRPPRRCARRPRRAPRRARSARAP